MGHQLLRAIIDGILAGGVYALSGASVRSSFIASQPPMARISAASSPSHAP